MTIRGVVDRSDVAMGKSGCLERPAHPRDDTLFVSPSRPSEMNNLPLRRRIILLDWKYPRVGMSLDGLTLPHLGV